MAYYYPTVGL